MENNDIWVRDALVNYNEYAKSSVIKQILKEKDFGKQNADLIIDVLCDTLTKQPENAKIIKTYFPSFLMPIASKMFEIEDNFKNYQRKCIALSLLCERNHQVLKFTIQHFTTTKLAPFHQKLSIDEIPRKKSRISDIVSELEIVECCLRFLKLDVSFFRQIWNWSEFIEIYFDRGCDLQKFYSNEIISLLFGMNTSQLEKLNKNIPLKVAVEARAKKLFNENDETFSVVPGNANLEWNFKSDSFINIEGVYLPIYDKSNHQFYANKAEHFDKIIRVGSTIINLRSLALGISSGKAICLSGPVGCGKTSLVDFLARKTGRIAPKPDEFVNFMTSKALESAAGVYGIKRKLRSNDLKDNQKTDKKITTKNGFLRIQLGDQTDSKVLLGQYCCTDVPGEFLWQPGVLTQAVINGYWLLLEDIDAATQDVCTVLTNLLENNFLNVPGFRENVKITPGFQIFVTLRTHKTSSTTATLSGNSPHSLLDKYLYTINILSLSRAELCEIICHNYPKLKTIAKRIVDVFLTFSSGCHNFETENIEMDVMETSKKVNDDDNEEILPYGQNISLVGLTNSGRMVSTRDLMKLCNRSNPNFQVTSSECAYFVFQNCVDLFCSHLPAGDVKTNLIVNIGARLGIIESRCVHLANDLKPSVTMTSDEITIGRTTLSRNSKEIYLMEKKAKFDDFESESQKKSSPPTFSFTRISSCALERIAVSVSQNEPVLLVGETGVGKTSSIQYLAYQTNHKLIVVNMNNQSDVSDLIGGFKPVDISYVIGPLRLEFEKLFSLTFDVEKNEKFLNNVSVCFNRGNFGILVKLMLKIIATAYKRIDDENVIERWQSLETKLKKLDHQLKNSINLSFAFIAGSLVNCIMNGDWVLLDEINLASTETLECLSTILEPEGSIVLLERGDFVPIKRHPDFRIFSCMNPSTDVGKKDLQVGIRNRFTEFFVDELTSENDLLILVGDYLNNTGIQKSRIHSIVRLYMKLRNMSQLELNDGLGNKPVFSLRTLCRALRTCAKNLCGSIERNIYESFCLSFLTQLDSDSHDKVLKLTQKFLVSDSKKILSQQIPKPDDNHLNFEGYWIQKGDKDVQECNEYILTESVKKNLKSLSRIISIGKLPILLQGPTSAGKTSLIEFIGKKSGNVCLRINNHEHTDLQEYIGTYTADVSGKLVFQEGVLVKAMRSGFWIILDELNLAPSDILEALNRVLDDNRELYIPETQTLIKAHPNFMLFATQNPPGIYGGRKTLSRAFRNRFIELHFNDIPKPELEVILEKRCLIPKSYAQKMVKTMSALQVNRRSTSTKNNFTLRDLFRWGNRYTFADKHLLDDKNYDWNQHLIDEGFLVLSAKMRNQFETEIIADALYQNFRKRISIENLFTLNNETSKVTKAILEAVTHYKGEINVVWTFEMRRMAVLVSKSIEFNEPILLVGPTGCGKTTICQILAEISGKTLRILNCHMHTEGADFLGGLRPHRDSESNNEQKQLFEWSDGPLINSMIEGNFFLADEISLAEDSVLERLNCVLESERTILLAEKGGIDDFKVNEDSKFVVKAAEGFQFLATMNPGGDYGKKELSPALRNRFTEIWCTAINSDEDLVKIAVNSLSSTEHHQDEEKVEKIAQIIIKTVQVLKRNVDKLNFSIRDVLAWVNYITKNVVIDRTLSLDEAFLFGLETIFLDALEMLPYENSDEIELVKIKIIKEMKKFIKLIIGEDFSEIFNVKDLKVESDEEKFGIHPFYLNINTKSNEIIKQNDFSFSAPTTKKNLFRVLSALSLNKAILLEGPPGVGKSSLVENIANAISFNIVRINLCEHTDIADLFGTDLPAESKEDEETLLGSFEWRDGPLLAALKATNTWILLDELNLAPQSVLEGLNAILDHRGEVFIPELNKTFKLGQQTRIFATQNPLRQGGGRKGLPQSFLNRFTKVYLRKLEKVDLLHVIRFNYGNIENVEVLKRFQLLEKMVTFSECLENSLTSLQFGYKGGPFEANLRDILRWCKLTINLNTGFDIRRLQDESGEDLFGNFLLVLFEKMKLVYCHRMRTENDVHEVMKIFGNVFECDDVEMLKKKSEAISLYWNDSEVFLSDIQCLKSEVNNTTNVKSSIILSSQLEMLRSVTECSLTEKPVILCGPSDCGKTKIIDTFCSIFNHQLQLDTIDDSVTGSFQQFDFNRMLENLWQKVEKILFKQLSELSILGDKSFMSELFKLWQAFDCEVIDKESSATSELESFKRRVKAVEMIIEVLLKLKVSKVELREMRSEVQSWMRILEKSSNILITGGRFEWIDSVIVKSIKFGHYICLEHVNLASSAILDRLNPALEPNGSLLISEKGVGENNEPENIKKHPNFRIFLTMDPKHGEISRAMRNRCIELSITRQTYTEDDLRQIVYVEGVREIYLLNAIMKIHRAASSISEFSTFGVSHLTKMSFLVAQNKALGVDDKKCLLMSALEVYVRSSNVDLLGFGLSYFRNKIKEIVVEEIQKVEKQKKFIDFDNLVLHADELTTMKLVKLQAEPLMTILRCLKDNVEDFHGILCDLSEEFSQVAEVKGKEVEKYLLTFFYMISSFSDVELRRIYLETMIEDEKLIKLNEELAKVVKNFTTSDFNLPWNSQMFPRLRPYQNMKLKSSDEFRITLTLLLEMALNEISVKQTVKKSQIDVVTYSKGVQTKLISDVIDNSLVSNLYEFLNSFKSFTLNFLRNSENIDEKSFVSVLTSFLWFNRMLAVSMGNLYINNSVDDDLIDQLNLHFKWITKHCLNFMLSSSSQSKDDKFVRIFNNISNFILTHCQHPLELHKKLYVKEFTNFLPFYDENQVNEFMQLNMLNDLVRIVPKMDRLYDFDEYQRRLHRMMSSTYRNLRKVLLNLAANRIDVFDRFKSFCLEIEVNEEKKNFEINQEIQELSQQTTVDEFSDNKFEIELLPISEYFALKVLTTSIINSCNVNTEYIAEIPSINSNTLTTFVILNDKRLDTLKRFAWKNNSKDFTRNFAALSSFVDGKVQNAIQQSFAINNIFCRSYNDEDNYQLNVDQQMFINGPLLTSNVIAMLLGPNGEIRGTGLGEIHQWKNMLKHLKRILWTNAEINHPRYNLFENHLTRCSSHAEKLLENIKAVKVQSDENEMSSDFKNDFCLLTEKLEGKLKEKERSWNQSFLITSLCSVVELNIVSYFPLMDPVRKNQLKSKYLNEDIDHLERLLLSYKFMSIVMNYKNLGQENCKLLELEIENIQKKLKKQSKRVAIRPNVCVYSSLVKDVNHFLSSCCHPKTMIELINEIEEVLKFEINYVDPIKNLETKKVKGQMEELVNKLNSWIISANKFEHHTMQPYVAFYRDFVEPIECCIASLKTGFMGLRSALQMKKSSIYQKKESGIFSNVNDNNELSKFMKNLIEFPSKPANDILTSTNIAILNQINDSETFYFKLVKTKILEICNRSNLSGKFTIEEFNNYDAILNICNEMWEKQEELKRKRQADEDSLYVTKTKCKEDDDETVKIREIAEIFPNYAEEDFNEFLQNETLEQITKTGMEKKKFTDILGIDDFKIIGDQFINLMNLNSTVDPSQDYFKIFESKLKIFHSIFDEFKVCLDNSLDDAAYTSLSLLVGLCQDSYDDLQLKDLKHQNYNFYKDSNITEAITCVDVLKRLEEKVAVELEQWPDHAVLNDLIRIINRIRNFPSNSPLARFNTGLQILRQKVDEWNSVAHKLNNFKDLEFEIAELIQKWMRMELQRWRESLNQSLDMVRSKAYRYWFFLYNLIHEFLADGSEEGSGQESSLVDFSDVEKRFSSDEVVEEKPKVGKISLESVTKVLRQFIESSNYAEYEVRMKLLKSFTNYLMKTKTSGKKSKLIRIMHNLHLYFTQFANQVQQQIEVTRKPVEKKLREFVKIESFNKDLSYFSMRSNIQRVHRHLHKILKEFELEVMKRIGDLLIYKNSGDEFQSFKASTSDLYSDLKVETFLTSPKSVTITPDESSKEILQRIEKYFTTSRKIVQSSIENSPYSSLIEKLHDTMEKKLETCLHLRSLEVDRNQVRNKQKSQAKHILNQKRKALSDFFKTLTSMGVSFKTGLLTNSLNSELFDLQIPSFVIDSISFDGDTQMEFRVKKISQKLDNYFNKSTLKMRQLTNALLMPRPDMDHAFLERMKGFSIDFFTLVQDQRKLLSFNVNEIVMLDQRIKDIEAIKSIDKEQINFEKASQKLSMLQESFLNTVEVLEQFKLLLKCSPEDSGEAHLRILNSEINTFTKNSDLYQQILTLNEEILSEAKSSLKISMTIDSRFNNNINFNLSRSFFTVLAKLKILRELFVIDVGYSIYSEPICELHYVINSKLRLVYDNCIDESRVIDDIDDQLDNLTHSILIAIQNIYKKFQEKIEDEEDDEVKLKEKIHKQLQQDFNTLNLQKINSKLNEVLDLIFISTTNRRCHKQLGNILPLIKQYNLLVKFFFFQQLCGHKLSVKMLSIMLSVFLELATKGFCVPQDLLSDEEQKEENDTKTGEGFGFEDGQGEKDVSDKLESEDQLDEARKPEDYEKKNEQDEEQSCKEEEKGIDMSDDFEGKMQDVDKNDDSDSDANDDENEELDKEMGETEEGAEKLDDQIWGSDDENEPEEDEKEKNEETGQGSGEKDEHHNDLDTEKNEADEGQDNEDGLDAAESNDDNNKKKQQQQKKNIEEMNEDGEDEDQTNPFHNELEEPPQPEDMNLDEDFNLDKEENEKEAKENQEENPFDIDTMKENMETNDDEKAEDDETNEDQQPEKKEEDVGSDEEGDETEKPDENQENSEDIQEENQAGDQETPQIPDEIPDDEKTEEKNPQNTAEDFKESKNQKSKEENIQAMPNQQQKGSHDDVQVDESDETAKQDAEIDEQDTGEDQDGVGQAENEESKSGHQGIADTKETKSKRNQDKNQQQQQKRKKGNTDEERTLGQVDKMEKKNLKTVDKLNRQEKEDDEEVADQDDTEEYQHVKDAKSTDKTTLDNATEEQSKKIQHDEKDSRNDDDGHEENDELMTNDEKEDPEMIQEKLESKKLDQKSDKKASKPNEQMNERLEQSEEVEVDGETVMTFNVSRGDETTAHCQMDIVNDATLPEEASTSEQFEMRKMVEAEVTSQKIVNPEVVDMERWQEISNRMMSNARELCEQLRLILEPTKCTRLKGDYRTGRRINMKKIIPYIASQFRKDKIWLRRTKAAQRDYKITIAVDDSKSMDHNNSKHLTLQAISLVSQALSLLESGKLCVMSFGESPKILLKYNDQLNGPKMLKCLNFDQNQSKIAELLDFSRTLNQEASSSENSFFEHLLIVLSDGRNIFSEGEQKVRNAVKMAKLQRMFIVYIIIDNPENKHSILDIRVPKFSSDMKTITMHSYLDTFPFPYYVIVRDLNQLPLVLSDGLRQWFELVNSE